MASIRCGKNVLVLGVSDSGAINVTLDAPLTVRDIKNRLQCRKRVEWSLFSLSRGGVILEDSDVVGEEEMTVLHAHPLLKGGKGGFGSLIRAMGSQINKSTNKEACRNLSGRRMRDVNAEKKLAKWAADEPERKRKETEEKRQRLERKRAGPKHTFDDTQYMEQIKTTEEEMGGALKQGLEASGNGTGKGKSKAVELDRPHKKPKLWLGVDEELTDSENEEEEQQKGSSNLDEVIEAQSDGTSKLGIGDSEPCCSSSIMDNTSSNTSSGETESASTTSGPKVETVVSADDKELTPCDQDGQSTPNHEPIDLSNYDSPEQLVDVGGERLKFALSALGLKCGGTLIERATRLFSTKGKTKEQLDPSLFAKPKRTKRKHK